MTSMEECLSKLKAEKFSLMLEKENSFAKLSQASEEKEKIEEKLREKEIIFNNLNFELEEVKKLAKDRESRMAELEESLKEKEIVINENKSEIDFISCELKKMKEELEVEKQNLYNKCLEVSCN